VAPLADLAWVALIGLAVLGIGLVVGMLLAPALTRRVERADDDEEPGARDG
jgi:formate-dependent nitrite reductase membrane component NrfD